MSLLILLFYSCNTNNNTKNNDSKEDSSSNVIDTLIAGDYILKFENVDSFPPNYAHEFESFKNKLKDSFSYNTDEIRKAYNKFLFKKYGNKYFYLTDSTLVLNLDNGKKLSFYFWDEKSEKGFDFEYYYKNIDYYLLSVGFYEGWCWMLVNKKNGFKCYIKGLPYISNDKKKILAINEDLYVGFSFNGIELYSVLQDSLKLEFSKELETWAPVYLKWINENQVLLRRKILDSNMKIKYDFKLLTIELRNKK
jgi:hypothetical protein